MGALRSLFDDGLVQMSKDAGKTWTNLTAKLPGFPAGAWVSEVVPSKYDANTVYVTVDAHRLNDYKTYIWASNDGANTCQRGNCKVDADCPSGFCSPSALSLTFNCRMNVPMGSFGYFCHSNKDECGNDSDCGATPL